MHSNWSRIARAVVLAGLFAALSASFISTSRAAFTSHFSDLHDELEVRSAALAGNPDKTAQKQKKACDKAIAAIEKEVDSLGDDLKTAGKVAKTLIKAFPEEFIGGAVADVTGLQDLLAMVYAGFSGDLQALFDQLQAGVSALPSGGDRDKAQSALDQAETLLGQAVGADFASRGKLLASALKSITRGLKIVGTGPPPGAGMTATIVDGGISTPWASDVATAEYGQSAGIIDLNGSSFSAHSSMSVPTFDFTGVGTYPLGNDVGIYAVMGEFYLIKSGTLVVTTFDVPTTTITATFSFTASNGTKTISVENGTAHFTDMLVSP
jgi:hypothetical protein